MGECKFFEAFGEAYSLEVFERPDGPGWAVVGIYCGVGVNSVEDGAELADFWAADAYATEFVKAAAEGRVL